ncbi:hypothetical protein HMPREF0044_0711 [Gleimia coleocanis DSM 15436]|uniref:Uncharacterized protein n=1 Tax=Gleimia coleocanis DSM 15436 TaxID=525245 RepID=C0W0W8_9ACTO|nr:hypothetical protein [Gleimia coleocanis]EEH63692.1 hypothetical protein HMPREF0044_0711 [Gleimia coleocanis DSM 15436]
MSVFVLVPLVALSVVAPLVFFWVAFVWGRGFFKVNALFKVDGPLTELDFAATPFRFLCRGLVPQQVAPIAPQLQIFVGLTAFFAVLHGVMSLVFGLVALLFNYFKDVAGLFFMLSFTGAIVVAGLAFVSRRFFISEGVAPNSPH